MCNIGVGLKCHCIEKRGADLKWKFCFMSRVVVFMIMEFLSHHTECTTTILTQKQHNYKNNICETTTLTQIVGTKTMLTQQQCWHKNRVGRGRLSAKQQHWHKMSAQKQHRQKNSVDTRTNTNSKTTTRVQ